MARLFTVFSENSVRWTTGREEGKTEIKENAIQLLIEDKRRKYGLHATKRTGIRQAKLVSMKMET